MSPNADILHAAFVDSLPDGHPGYLCKLGGLCNCQQIFGVYEGHGGYYMASLLHVNFV